MESEIWLTRIQEGKNSIYRGDKNMSSIIFYIKLIICINKFIWTRAAAGLLIVSRLHFFRCFLENSFFVPLISLIFSPFFYCFDETLFSISHGTFLAFFFVFLSQEQLPHIRTNDVTRILSF